MNDDFVYKTFDRLFDYVKRHNYKGIDLFDGLNSNIFKTSPFYQNKYFRIFLVYLCQNSPINFRNLLCTPLDCNPKALALFALGNLNMYKVTNSEFFLNESKEILKLLKSIGIKRDRGISWGYNFDRQLGTYFVPKGTPDIVTSSFVGRALTEFYKITHEQEYIDNSAQIAEFILNEMIKFENKNYLCFSSISGNGLEIHNANLIAASFLSLINSYIGNICLNDKILKALKYSVSDMNYDGSWHYGTRPFHKWIDNLHTAYNIEALLDIRDNTSYSCAEIHANKALDYYLNNLFTEQGLPKYYSNKVYPLDIHTIAQTIVLLNRIKVANIHYNKSKAWIIEQKIWDLVGLFQDKEGYFYHQKGYFLWNKIPYIRWGQAWMFYALSLEILNNQPKEISEQPSQQDNIRELCVA